MSYKETEDIYLSQTRDGKVVMVERRTGKLYILTPAETVFMKFFKHSVDKLTGEISKLRRDINLLKGEIERDSQKIDFLKDSLSE